MRYLLFALLILFAAGCKNERETYDEHTFMYVLNSGENTISAFRIDLYGTLMESGTLTLPSLHPTYGVISLHPSNRFLYAQLNGQYAVCRVEIDGSMSEYQEYPGFVLKTKYSQNFHPNGKWSYNFSESSADNTIYYHQIDQNSGYLNGNSTNIGTDWKNGLIMNPNGRFFYVINSNGSGPESMTINNDGSFSSNFQAPFAANTPAIGIIHPTGKYIYGLRYSAPDTYLSFIPVINEGAALDVLSFTQVIVSNTGLPQWNFFLLHPNGHFLYVAVGDSIYGYAINQVNGNLTSIGVVYTFTTAPDDAAFYPDGDWLYVANSAANKVSVLNVNSLTGAMSLNREIPVGSSPKIIIVGRNKI